MRESIREILPALAGAAAIIVVAIVLGLVVASRLGPREPTTGTAIASPSASIPGALPSTSTAPTASTARPSAAATATATPIASPSAIESPSIVEPTPPTGITEPLPPLDIVGADPEVVRAIGEAVEKIDELDAYRFISGISGRSILDLSQNAGLNLGMRGSIRQKGTDRLDARIGFQMVEFNGAAATSFSSRLVRIGDEAWDIGDDGEAVKAEGDLSSLTVVDVVMPQSLAERTIVPFAGGYERVGPETHAGTETIHYRSTPTGRDAYAEVTGLGGAITADVWIAAEGGHLIAAEIHGASSGGDDGLIVQIELTDVNDPDIVIKRPT